MPPGVWVYVASGRVHVMARKKDGSIFETGSGSVDRESVVDSVPRESGYWDRGDW